ncbi:polysaccharide biosynthesis protein [Altererythrobacter sp. MF3-039]|uniref:polysaccharide biosynthesis protein n=1 Tax=Altererythrobacter sp. MF3-039 TaxID=3252901 RepID=UPI00390C9B53
MENRTKVGPLGKTESDLSRKLAPRFSAILLNLLALDRSRKRLIVFVLDTAMCFLATILAFSLRVGALAFPLEPPLLFFAAAFVCFTAVFGILGVYKNIFRYSGGGTVMHLGWAFIVYSLPLIAVFLLWGVKDIPRTIAILQPMIFFGMVAFGRIAVRYLFIDVLGAEGRIGTTRRVLVYGAGAAGQQLALSSRHDSRLNIVGFLDDDPRLDGQKLDGLPIYDSARLGALLETTVIDTILLAMPQASRARRAEIVNELRNHLVEVQTLPELHELVDGQVSLRDLREVRVEDLLGRDPVKPNELLLAKAVVGKTVMVTGAGGSIGSELSRQIIAMRPTQLILVEMTEHALYEIETELRENSDASEAIEVIAELETLIDEKAVERMVGLHRPHTIFHAAAYKHVPLVESNAISGMKNNILSTRHLVTAARKFGTERFILISTDKAVRPTNIMGASKRVCELVLQAMAAEEGPTCFAMVRFGNVLGSSGSVVPRFQAQISDGGPVTVTHKNVTRYFMTIPEAAQLVIQAGGMAEGGEVYLLDMGEPVLIADLARTMINLSGLQVRDENNPEGDIEIREVGLRSGEKLFEELLIDADAQKTKHPRIMRAHETYYPRNVLDEKLDRLLGFCAAGSRDDAVGVLRQLVPEYSAEANLAASEKREGATTR